MEAFVLASGSSGNALLIREGADAVLVDAGRSCRYLTAALAALGMRAEELRGVFLTHEHTDHTAALSRLLACRPLPLHATAPSALYLPGELAEHVIPHPVSYETDAGGLHVQSLVLSHDSAACVGFRVTGRDGETLGIATDTGCVTGDMQSALPGCDAVYLEANHDTARLAGSPYPAFLKARIASPRGHLSNAAAAALAVTLAASGTRRLVLGHLSEHNNTPSLALAAVTDALRAAGSDLTPEAAPPAAILRIL